jgi:hypothetical protein
MMTRRTNSIVKGFAWLGGLTLAGLAVAFLYSMTLMRNTDPAQTQITTQAQTTQAQSASCSMADIKIRNVDWSYHVTSFVRVKGKADNDCAVDVQASFEAVARDSAGNALDKMPFYLSIPAHDSRTFDHPLSSDRLEKVEVKVTKVVVVK